MRPAPLPLLLLCAALQAANIQEAVAGQRLVFHFSTGPIANLTFQLDAMSGFANASPEAYRALWTKELRWSSEDEHQLDIWKQLHESRRRLAGDTGANAVSAPWPPNYAAFYGSELGVEQAVRIVGFQSSDAHQYWKGLRKLLPRDQAEQMAGVVRHFEPRFREFWSREGNPLVQPAVHRFAALCRERDIPALAEDFARLTGARLQAKHHVWFYLIAHPKRYSSGTMATQMRNHAVIEFTSEDMPQERLSVVIHELVHHFYESAPTARHLALIDEFRAMKPSWRMAAYSYLNEAVATAAGIATERRLRDPDSFAAWLADSRNVYRQPWIAALGKASVPVISDFIARRLTIFDGFSRAYMEAVERGLGERVYHPHFLLASRIVLVDDPLLREAAQRFNEGVPSIVSMSGWESLDRFPEVPVVLFTTDSERKKMVRRLSGSRQLSVFSAVNAVEVERDVERFRTLPF